MAQNQSNDELFLDLSEFDIAILKQSFSHFDTQCDKTILGCHLLQALRHLAESPGERRLQRAVRSAKIGDADRVSFPEYVRLARTVVPFEMHDRLLTCLQVLSLDKNAISKDLLRRSLLSFGATMPESEIEELVTSVPADENGNISIGALVDFLLS